MKSASPKIILVLAYLTYLFFGAFTGGIGPVLGELSQQTSSTLAAIGGVLTFLFLGSLVAQLVAGPLIDRFGQKPVMVVSLFILAGGILAFTSASVLTLMFLLALFTGLGQGGVDMGANLVVTDAAPRNSTSALNLLHFFFGAGAFVGPALVGVAIAAAGSGLIVHRGVALLFLLLALAMIMLLRSRSGAQAAAPRGPKPVSSTVNVYFSPLLWLLGGLILIYVGVEFGIGSWISSYMHLTVSMSAQYGAWVTSAYWASLAIGRLAGAAASHRLARLRLLAIALAASLLGAVGLFFTRGLVVPTVLCLVWISFSYGTVYPTTVAVAADAYPGNQGKAVSVLVAMGNIGGLTLPWFAGLLLDSSVRLAYLWFVALSILALLALLFSIYRTLQRPALANAAP
jgi:fucose permease